MLSPTRKLVEYKNMLSEEEDGNKLKASTYKLTDQQLKIFANSKLTDIEKILTLIVKDTEYDPSFGYLLVKSKFYKKLYYASKNIKTQTLVYTIFKQIFRNNTIRIIDPDFIDEILSKQYFNNGKQKLQKAYYATITNLVESKRFRHPVLNTLRNININVNKYFQLTYLIDIFANIALSDVSITELPLYKDVLTQVRDTFVKHKKNPFLDIDELSENVASLILRVKEDDNALKFIREIQLLNKLLEISGANKEIMTILEEVKDYLSPENDLKRRTKKQREDYNIAHKRDQKMKLDFFKNIPTTQKAAQKVFSITDLTKKIGNMVERSCINKKDYLSSKNISDIPTEFLIKFHLDNEILCMDLESLVSLLNDTTSRAIATLLLNKGEFKFGNSKLGDPIRISPDEINMFLEILRKGIRIFRLRPTELLYDDTYPFYTIEQHKGGSSHKGGAKKIRKIKQIRKHKGLNQTTGRLNKGYKYSGKKSKTGLRQIVRKMK